MLAVVISGGLSPKAHAYEATISAEYQPGGDGKFAFTSPHEGECADRPYSCSTYGDGSIAPSIALQWGSLAASPPERQRLAIKVPAGSRKVTLADAAGSSRKLEISFRFTRAIVKLLYPKEPPSAALVDIWGPGVHLPSVLEPSPCSIDGIHSTSSNHVMLDWKYAPSTDGALCSVRNTKVVEGPLRAEYLNLLYNIGFPGTSSAHAGEYRGKLELAVGPHGDFDFGDNAQSSLNRITLNFKITIKPIFNVQFASNTMDVHLAPPGGWSGWIDHGIRPDVLRAEIPFYLTASTPIELKVKCQYVGASTGMDGACALKRRGAAGNFGKDRAPLRLRLDIPGMRDHRGIPAHNLGGFTFSSSTQANSYWRLYPYSYIQNARSRISIELLTRANSQHADVLAYPGATFAGTITLIFEAQLN